MRGAGALAGGGHLYLIFLAIDSLFRIDYLLKPCPEMIDGMKDRLWARLAKVAFGALQDRLS